MVASHWLHSSAQQEEPVEANAVDKKVALKRGNNRLKAAGTLATGRYPLFPASPRFCPLNALLAQIDGLSIDITSSPINASSQRKPGQISSLLSLPNDHIMQARAACAVLIHTICRDWTKHFTDKDFIRDLMTEINGCPRGNHRNNRIRPCLGIWRETAGRVQRGTRPTAGGLCWGCFREGDCHQKAFSFAPWKNQALHVIWGSLLCLCSTGEDLRDHRECDRCGLSCVPLPGMTSGSTDPTSHNGFTTFDRGHHILKWGH